MAYLKAAGFAALSAVLIGVGTASWSVLQAALALLRPEDKASVLSRAVSEGVNCLALYWLILTPVALGIAYLVRRRARRAA
jgi:hypothetical protein